MNRNHKNGLSRGESDRVNHEANLHQLKPMQLGLLGTRNRESKNYIYM